MPNILIVGATGYVGQVLAGSLTRSGQHIVYGVTRTPEKAALLSRLEVIPVIGSISDSASLTNLINTARIDVVVDVSGANAESKVLLEVLSKAGAARLAAAKAAGFKAPKLGFIYTSGTWVHGSSNKPVNDLMPVGSASSPTPPAKLTAWRAVLEQEILVASDVLDTMIVRPALIYGRASTIWSELFESLAQGAASNAKSVSLTAQLDSRLGLVHVDDVASGLQAAIEKLPLLSGTGVYPVFDLVTSQESMRDILDAAANTLGYRGELQLVGTEGNLFMEAMSTSFNGSSARAIQLLGWKPARYGFVQGMNVYAQAWLMAQ
jgi:nucleoside-diphosphate-sugar epimerase